MIKINNILNKMSRVWFIFFVVAGCSNLAEFHPLEWRVGQWVSYKINNEPLEVAIVGQESTLFWVETSEPEIIVKVLVERGKIIEPKRLIVKKVGESPIEFKVAEFSIKGGLPVMESKNLGDKEILTLPCGKIKAVHIREEKRDVWLSDAIPIFGIVKYKTKDTLIVLQNYGIKGAKSGITESVEVINL